MHRKRCSRNQWAYHTEKKKCRAQRSRERDQKYVSLARVSRLIIVIDSHNIGLTFASVVSSVFCLFVCPLSLRSSLPSFCFRRFSTLTWRAKFCSPPFAFSPSQLCCLWKAAHPDECSAFLSWIYTLLSSCSVEIASLQGQPSRIWGTSWGVSAVSLAVENLTRLKKMIWGTSALRKSWGASHNNSKTQKCGISQKPDARYLTNVDGFVRCLPSLHNVYMNKMNCLTLVSIDMTSVMSVLRLSWGCACAR